MFDVVVHRRSLSSTREDRTEPRINFNTSVTSGRNMQNGGRDQVCNAVTDSRTPQHRKPASTESETTPLTTKRPQNDSHSGKTYGY